MSNARAEWGYGVSGNLGTGFRYVRTTNGETTTWSADRTNQYTLGLDGKILDRRLATFNVAGALSTSDVSSNQKSGAEDSRLFSFAGNVTLLPGKPYPVDLRFSQSHLTGSANTDVLSFGGSWRVVYRDLPAFFFNFDRINIQSTGLTRADDTFTTGAMRVSKRFSSSEVDGEFGLQHFASDITGRSSFRHFGRFGDTTRWSPATTFRVIGDYFLQEESRSFGSNFSLINQPDPTLRRSFGFGIRNTAGRDTRETTLDANGAVSKAFQPYATLSVTPFTRALLIQRFASGSQEDSSDLNWSLGSSLVSSYFRSVLASADYGLGLSFSRGEEGSNFGTTQQIHLGLQSRTLYPHLVRGDYTFTLERTLTDRIRHQASLRADGPIIRSLFFRSYAELFNENATFSELGTKVSARQTTLSFGAGLSYTGIDKLYLDVGGNAQRLDSDSVSSWITRLAANLNYRPRDRLSLIVNALRETDSLNNQTRYEAAARILYLFGRATIDFEYRFESSTILDRPGRRHSVSIQVNRPFRFFF